MCASNKRSDALIIIHSIRNYHMQLFTDCPMSDIHNAMLAECYPFHAMQTTQPCQIHLNCMPLYIIQVDPCNACRPILQHQIHSIISDQVKSTSNSHGTNERSLSLHGSVAGSGGGSSTTHRGNTRCDGRNSTIGTSTDPCDHTLEATGGFTGN